MSTASSHTSRTSNPSIAYVPPADRQALIAEAIGCIITGRPLPAHLAPQPVAIARPATVAEGIARILAPER